MSKVIHFELPADDPRRAIAFYEKVFGWTISKWEGPMDYWLKIALHDLCDASEHVFMPYLSELSMQFTLRRVSTPHRSKGPLAHKPEREESDPAPTGND